MSNKRVVRRDKRLDWTKFTDFRSRNTKADLVRLCSGLSKTQMKQVFESRDTVGLCPIHWAAIHNRSDMIEFMVENGTSLRRRCRNKLFADGTPLHLASINGSLEAAATILKNDNSESREMGTTDESKNGSKSKSEPRASEHLIHIRDSEGQTPLMRSAAPRSKRINTVRDLLSKNLWSLSGRPAEMALFLICNGANWRDTEPVNGMNLMHLAIVNDYDDIVNLLLVIDKRLLNVVVSLPLQNKPKNKRSSKEPEETRPKGVDDTSSSSGFETVSLGSTMSETSTTATNKSKSSSQSDSSAIAEPLINNQAKAKGLISKGLEPLQLAILYGRVSIISLLWHAKATEQQQRSQQDTIISGLETQRKAIRQHSTSIKDLKRVLIRACWTNKEELARLIRVGILKGALALDLGLLALIWAPYYASADDNIIFGLRGGIFILSYCISMALAIRVMLKNPGYLRKNSVQYLNELSQLIRNKEKQATKSSDNAQETKIDELKTIKLNLIKLDASSQQQVDKATNKPDRQFANAYLGNELSNVSIGLPNTPNWQAQFGDLKEKVRLLCHKCRCIRRPRSKHCNYCNHCVQDFDHHCIYLGCCIGRNNRLDFLLTMIALSIMSIYGTLIQSTLLHQSEWSNFWHLIGLIWVLKYVLIGGIKAFLNLRRACWGVTLFEDIRSKRIRQIFGPSGPPESINKSHKAYSILKDSFWRYSPDRFATGELPARDILNNLKEFTNFISLDEYFLTLICTDTTLARSLSSSDSRINMYKFV